MTRENDYTAFKMCKLCGRPISISYEPDYCPSCVEEAQFKEIREYIREHDVTEHMLAEVFNIPLKKVHKWIAEGRIEYVEGSDGKSIKSVFCQRCGDSISFGTFCPACARIMNGDKTRKYISMSPKESGESNRMRFLDQEKPAQETQKTQVQKTKK